ncbi:pentatricopeptide repeat-containing protein At1g18485 [Apium graveolens]|uniref:pentatricopeptide repeat-containing protein At1g18485 n=1 Tax=Apium graveolens TaxID=4045 RepID=UPI003D7BC622
MSAVAPPLSLLHHHLQVEKPKNCKSTSPHLTPQNSHFSLPHQVNSLCQSNDLDKALKLLQLEAKNVERSSTHMVAAMGLLLQASGNKKEIETGRKVHELVCASIRYNDDFFLNTSVITMYSNCGFPLDSRVVFDQLSVKDLCLWNALVSGYVRNGLWFDAVLVFCEMLSACECKPDNFTFPCVIKACGEIMDLRLMQGVHGLGLKMGLTRDVFVCNALVSSYGKFGLVADAARVFENNAKKNLVSWNSMISVFLKNGFYERSLDLFRRMLTSEEGIVPDVATLVSLLPVCAAEGNIEMGRMIHCIAVKMELSKEVKVNNALVDMYAKCGYVTEAQVIFDKNDSRNTVSWNSLIAAYSRGGDVCQTFKILQKMQVASPWGAADEVTILNVLPVCSQSSELSSVRVLHAYSLRHGFQYNELVCNAFITAYAKCGSSTFAQNVFSCIENRTVTSWNALLGGYAQNGDPSKAIDIYLHMSSFNLNPDWFSISSLLLACAELKSLRYGKEVHVFLLKNGLVSDSHICVSLISLYNRCGRPLCAKFLFGGMEDRSLVSWNAMISGYSQNRLPNEAINLFRELVYAGIQPHEIAITSVLGACSQLSALRLGKETHCFALKSCLMDDMYVGSCIIDMYSHSGSIKQSQRVFEHLKKRDVASWTCLISGYGIHGRGKEALNLFREMQMLGFKPDAFTYIGVLMACNHMGLIEEGMKCLNEMQVLHGVEPKLEHYACVIDMLGRAGRFTDAIKLIQDMHVEPDAAIWNSLLSSCRFRGELHLGKQFGDKLLQLEPNKPENYILLSNLFAGFGKWDDVRRIRLKMKKLGLEKEDAGSSWIEVEGKTYNFVAGDKTFLVESKQIQQMWTSLNVRINEIGYVA